MKSKSEPKHGIVINGEVVREVISLREKTDWANAHIVTKTSNAVKRRGRRANARRERKKIQV